MNYQAAIDLQEQAAFIAALLSGFSITFLIGLLQMKKKKDDWLMKATIVTVSFSAFCLIISTIASVSGAFWLTERPNLASLPGKIQEPELLYAFRWTAMSFVFGLNSLLITIGLSGFLHSRLLGRITIGFAIVSLILIYYFWIFLVDIN